MVKKFNPLEESALVNLIKLTRKLFLALDLKSLNQIILEQVAPLSSADATILSLYQDNQAQSIGSSGIEEEGARKILNELIKEVGMGVKPLKLKSPSGTNLQKEKIGFVLFFPLKSEKKYFGQLFLLKKITSGDFNQRDIKMAKVIASQLAASLLRLKEKEEVSNQLKKLETLYKVSNSLQSTLEIKKLINRIMSTTASTLQAEACSVLLVDEQAQELEFFVAKGEKEEALSKFRLPLGQGIAGWVVENKEPVLIEDAYKDKRFYQKVDTGTGFRTKSMIAVPLLIKDKAVGVIEVLNKKNYQSFDQEDLKLLQAIASQASTALDNAKLYEKISQAYLDTMAVIAAAIDAKDPYTQGHSERVTKYSLFLAQWSGYPSEQVTMLQYGGTLHDVGKIGIADNILRKPGKLNDDEYQIMKNHTVIGASMVGKVTFLQEGVPLVRGHHERYDGRGYPDGIKGEEIPLGARIIAVADTFDALTSDRPYRPALPLDKALSEITNVAGSQLDPELAPIFVKRFKKDAESLYLYQQKVGKVSS